MTPTHRNPDMKTNPPTHAAHTPGPWQVHRYDDCTLDIIAPWTAEHTTRNSATYGDYRGGIICKLTHGSTGSVPTREQAEANAALIADAPRLAALNGELVTALEQSVAAMEMCVSPEFADTGELIHAQKTAAALTAARAALAKATGGAQ